MIDARRSTHAHRVFGGVLRSPWHFHELRSCDPAEPSDWTLEACAAAPAHAEIELLGEESVNATASVRLARHAAGLRLMYTDTGVFDVCDRGRRLHWHGTAGVDLDAVRADVLGRVLAAALHEAGGLALHASAVAIGDRAVAFIAPKRHGKSTLAMALVSAGARLLSDDILPIDLATPVVARPGVHSVLLDDAASRALGLDESGARRGDKRAYSGLAHEQLATDRIRLAAIYALHPVTAAPAQHAARRQRLHGPAAALALTAHARLGALMARHPGQILERASRVAADVPVYGLAVARDLARLPAVVRQLEAWHGGDEVTDA